MFSVLYSALVAFVASSPRVVGALVDSWPDECERVFFFLLVFSPHQNKFAS